MSQSRSRLVMLLAAVAVGTPLAFPATGRALECARADGTAPLPVSVPCTVFTHANASLVTVDIRLTEDLGRETGGDLVVELPGTFEGVRRKGYVLQLYYGRAFGRAQWTPFPAAWSANRLFIQNGAILLPVQWWFEKGLPAQGWVRMVVVY